MLEHGTTSVVQGWYVEFQGAVLSQLPRDIDPTTADGWVNNQAALKKVLLEALLPTEKTAYPVVVDYGKSVEEMVESGRYGIADSSVTSKNFPTKRTGKTELTIKLIHFNRKISDDEALKKLDGMGYRPAELHELLAFGERYPEVQREFPIVALDSVWQDWRGRRWIASLHWLGSMRVLHVYGSVDPWDDRHRFAAVRK